MGWSFEWYFVNRGHNKDHSKLIAVGAKHRTKFCSPLVAMLTSLYGWNILEQDKNKLNQLINQSLIKWEGQLHLLNLLNFERLSNDDTDNILSLTKCVSELVLAHTKSIKAQTVTGKSFF